MSLYQHILALLALLTIVSGCTQLPPPKLRILDQAEDQDQKIKKKDDSIVKPTPQTDDSSIQLKVNGELLIVQDDAKMLEQSLAVAVTGEKRGKQIVCAKTDSTKTECRLNVELAKGAITIQNSAAAAVTTVTVLKDDYQSKNLSFKKDDQMGVLTMMGEVAKTLYVGMSQPVATISLSGNDTYLPGQQKKGQHLNCYEQYLKTDAKTPLYTCYIYFKDRTTGEFDLVQ